MWNRKKVMKFGFIILVICIFVPLSIFLFNVISGHNKSSVKSDPKNELREQLPNSNFESPYNPITDKNAVDNKAVINNLNAVKKEDVKKQIKSKKGGLPVLMYHAIDDKIFGIKEMFVSTSSFDGQMKYLSDNGYTAIDFSEIKNYEKYRKPIIITFDDGYEDNYTNAYPILKKYKLKATIFVPSSFIDTPQYLTSRQIKEMSDLISFQSHSVTHPKLTIISKEELEKECKESQVKIEKITGKPVVAFAYPFGIFNKAVVKAVSKVYLYAISSNFGYYKKGDDNYAIRRIGVSYLFKLKDFAGWLE